MRVILVFGRTSASAANRSNRVSGSNSSARILDFWFRNASFRPLVLFHFLYALIFTLSRLCLLGSTGSTEDWLDIVLFLLLLSTVEFLHRIRNSSCGFALMDVEKERFVNCLSRPFVKLSKLTREWSASLSRLWIRWNSFWTTVEQLVVTSRENTIERFLNKLRRVVL